MTTAPSFCRSCGNACGILVEVDDGRVTRVTGDPENPLYRGYSCSKGRAIPEDMNGAGRLLHSQKRQPDGSYAPIPVAQAMDEIAERLLAIVGERGPRALAVYMGTMAVVGSAKTSPILGAFVAATATPMFFTPATIDSPGKLIAKAMHGGWMAPTQGLDRPDVVLMVGSNPLVSFCGGIANGDPRSALERVADGRTKWIVIDPRRSDVAKRASIHLQPRPGEDAAILACMIRTIIEEGLYDAEFVEAHVTGLDELRGAVAACTPDVVARRADVDAADLVEAARLFAGAARGAAVAGTGPSMSGWSTLVEYLILCLDTLCGHYLRAGDAIPNPGTFLPPVSNRAQAQPPWPAHGFGEQLRVRGLATSAAGLSVTALPDEILLDGPGQVRALISCGGNPVAAWPDQARTIEALDDLDLLVQIDIRMSGTARMADYVIAVTHPLETDDLTRVTDSYARYTNGFGYTEAYGQFAPRVVPPPAGSELIEDWELFHGLAQRMGLTLSLSGVTLDMEHPPSSDQLLELITSGSRIPLDDVKRHPHGAFFPDPALHVEPAEPGWTGRLDIGADDMTADLRSLPLDEPVIDAAELRLICRRLPYVFNSGTHAGPANRRTHNPAFLHPDDLERLGLAADAAVEIRSAHGSITAFVQPDPTLRPGLVSMTHAFGDAAEPDIDVRAIGSNTGRLMSADVDFERYSGQPRMSNLPVTVTPTVVREGSAQ